MSWLKLDPATWQVRVAGYEQLCPDGCGNRIIIGQTLICSVDGGGWRRYECARRQWETHNNTLTGTEADVVSAFKRVSKLGGRITNGSWDSERPRDARFHWTEVLP